MGGGVGENYLPQESSTVLSKSSKLAWAPPITPVVQATSLLARLWFFPLPPSGIPTPLQGNYGKVPYTPFATRKSYPLHIPTQLILGMKISLIVRVSLLILHPDPFYSKSYNVFCCPFIYSTLVKTWSPFHLKPEQVPLSGTSSYMLSRGIPFVLTPEAPCFLWKLIHKSKYKYLTHFTVIHDQWGYCLQIRDFQKSSGKRPHSFLFIYQRETVLMRGFSIRPISVFTQSCVGGPNYTVWWHAIFCTWPEDFWLSKWKR